jgi:hypothetical protein
MMMNLTSDYWDVLLNEATETEEGSIYASEFNEPYIEYSF